MGRVDGDPGTGARDDDDDRSRLRWDRIALACIAVGAAIRIAWTLGVHPPLDHVFSDMQAYVRRASHLADGEELTRYDSFFPPGTHVLLAVPLRIFGTGRTGLWAGSVLWTALSCLIPYLGWRVARWHLAPRGAALAAAGIALWPLAITYGGFFLSETPSTVCLLLVVWLSYEGSDRSRRGAVLIAAAWGLSAGVALAVRPQLALNVAIAGLVLLARPLHRAQVVLAAGVCLVVPVVATLALNAQAAGHVVGLSENGGLNFFQGHCVVHDVHTGRPGAALNFASPVAVQLDRGDDYVFPDHIAWEQDFYFDLGWDCIRGDGIGHVRVLARNVADLGFTTTPWPQSADDGLHRVVNISNGAYSMLVPTVIVFTVIGIAAARRRTGRFVGEAVLLAHLLAVIPTAVIFYGDPRFRTPSDALGVILLAALIDGQLRLRRRDRSEGVTSDGPG